MVEQETILGFIPARGGSKGLTGKNLYPILDKPLLQYTLDEVQKSQYLNDLMLSSEDAEINAFAQKCGLTGDYVRPMELAADSVTNVEVLMHALDWLEARDRLPDAVVLLQPTTPLRTVEEIDAAILQFLESERDSLISVQPMREHPYKCLKVQGDDWRYLAQPDTYVSQRQAFDDDYYVINGAIYIATPQFLREHRRLAVAGLSDLFMMDAVSGVDVDDLADVYQVEALLKMRQAQME
jgi:N-acylneuraminate cytidylyltransferase/CMP-N,N'-diacetyllegionaminic acid synthase